MGTSSNLQVVLFVTFLTFHYFNIFLKFSFSICRSLLPAFKVLIRIKPLEQRIHCFLAAFDL